MRTNRSWTMTAFVGLAGIVFFSGCGSQRKEESPPPKTVEATENTSTIPEGISPGPKSPEETGPKPKIDIRPKMLTKRSAPPKVSAKPAAPIKSLPPPPAWEEKPNSPLRGSTGERFSTSNPIRTENPPAGEWSAESQALPPDESGLPMGQKLMMQETEGATKAASAGAAPIESAMETAPTEPAPAEPASAEPTSAESAPADINEFIKAAQARTEEAQGKYTVVKVFYGTDRASLNGPKPDQPVYLLWLMRTILVGLVTLFLSIMGFRYYRSGVVRCLAYSGILATLLLACLTIYARFQTSPPVDLANIPPSDLVSYGPERGKLELGICEVSIPKSHEVGELESPSILRLEFHEDPNRHVILAKVHREPEEQFFTSLRECVGRSSRKSALVFIHGYNTTFDDAARRTAQIVYDLKFEGAPIFYSWPSQGQILQYAVDETNVTWTAPHLLRFLTEVSERSGAERIHLIAHSMGNRALTSALRDIALSQKSAKPMFNEIVLTAPDIDAEVFINDIAPAVVKTAERVTLYASSNDEALVMSKKVHGYPRAGDSGSQIVVVPGVDTVDVSAVDTSLLGHNYYGDNSSVLADIFELLHASKPADQRQWLRPQRLGLLKYWVFQQ